MTTRFVSFQAIFILIRAENDQRPERKKAHDLNNRTVPFPNVEPTSKNTKIMAAHQ